MKIYIDAIEDEYPFTMYAEINTGVAKEQQQLFVGPVFVTYSQINANFVQVWALLMSNMETPNNVHDFALIMQKQALLAHALSEFIIDIDMYYSALPAILTQYQNNVEQDLDEEPDPEITTLEEIESHPPSRTPPTLGY